MGPYLQLMLSSLSDGADVVSRAEANGHRASPLVAQLAELTTKAGKEIHDIDVQRIENSYQLNGIDPAISGLNFCHPRLTAANALAEVGLRDFLLSANGSQQFDECFVVVTGWG
jgi:hypothetical protein